MVKASGVEVTLPGDGASLPGLVADLPIGPHLARLATFPEQNPNPVIETNDDGEVTYLNPAAETAFPDLRRLGPQHPLLTRLAAVVAELRTNGKDFVERDVDVVEAVYEQRICYMFLPTGGVVRIYAHDVTARRRAEQTLHEMARRLVLAEEQERRRVSRELHDESGQALAALKISLQILRGESDPGQLQQGLGDAISLVEQTREQIRLLAQGLRPPALDALNLGSALEGFCHDFSRWTDLRIEFRGGPVPEPIDAVRICLYRFLQEALANAARHADATTVMVDLGSNGFEIWLRVADDGKGIDLTALRHHEGIGLGLLGMRERIQLLSGRLRIESTPGGGTRLEAHLPLGET